jgi:Raf kinase inhibitor-like YbhB/YbcL family protein
MSAMTMSMQIHTDAFADHQEIPAEYAKKHGNHSPCMVWDDEPIGTVELAITCIDPTASFVHWLVAGIDPRSMECTADELPAGAIEGTNDFGEIGYGGPQPPAGDAAHDYVFQVHAMAKPSGLQRGFSHDELQACLADCEIGTGEWIGLYQTS